MTRKKIAALVLTGAMLLALMSGCSGGGTEPAEESASASPSAAPAEETPAAETVPAEESAPAASPDETPAAESAPAESEDTAIDYSKYATPDNVETLLAGRPSVFLPITENGETISYWIGAPSMDSGLSDWADHTVYKKFEELTGVKVAFTTVAPPTMKEKFNLMVVSGEYTDILTECLSFVGGDAQWLIDQGITVDVSGYVDADCPSFNAIRQADPAYAQGMLATGGGVAGLAGYDLNTYQQSGPIVRKDWLEELNMSSPATIDDYYNYLTGLKTSGLCQGGMAMMYNTLLSDCDILAAMGGYASTAFNTSFYYDENDELVFGWTSDVYKQYIKLMHQWYDEGLICPDLLDTSSARIKTSDVANGVYGLFWQDAEFMSTMQDAGELVDPDFMLTGVSEPLAEAGQTIPLKSITTYKPVYFISSSCPEENIDIALKWLDFGLSEEGSHLAIWGNENEGFVYDENGKEQRTDLIMNNPDGISYTNALVIYTLSSGGCFTFDKANTYNVYSDVQKQSIDLWGATRTYGKNSLISHIAIDTDTRAELATIWADMYTYIEESAARFLVGESDIDAEWDSYVSTVESFDLQTLQSTLAEIYDAYYAGLE